MLYKIIRSLLFILPPEEAHHFTMFSLKLLFKLKFLRNIIYRLCNKFNKEVKINNLIFKNRCGLAAGFDKNAKYLYELSTFGFAFLEIGTVTPRPQKGNPRPRLFRLVKDYALINRMGLNNDGVDAIYLRLKKYRQSYPNENVVIGANIGKNKDTLPEYGYMDIIECFNKLYDLVDYFTINVSCPNVKNNTDLQDPEILNNLLNKIKAEQNLKAKYKPVFIKVSPDLTFSQIDQIIDILIKNKIDGIVVSNTTTDFTNLKTSNNKIAKIAWGGLSGRPLKEKSNKLISYICNKLKNTNIIIIASGGIINIGDAVEKINRGALLLQLYTGFIYSGPFIIRNINKTLFK